MVFCMQNAKPLEKCYFTFKYGFSLGEVSNGVWILRPEYSRHTYQK